jgi:cell cycle protein kinase DBF2
MASFMANLFPGGKQDKSGVVSRPETPTKNNFITPQATPQGSPSKKQIPPGANELPVALESLKLNPAALDTPTKLRPTQASMAPLSTGTSNILSVDDSSIADDSILHKGISSGSPTKRNGKENTAPPVANRFTATEPAIFQPSHAALSRHEAYHQKDRPLTPTVKKFNTSRGLTTEELEILQRPGVKRLTNVTQLCT